MIITKEILKLVDKIETAGTITPYFKELLNQLEDSCLATVPYSYKTTANFPQYPFKDGYAVAIDVLTQEEKLREYFHTYGFVVGRHVVEKPACQNAVNFMLETVKSLAMNLDDSSTWVKDDNGTALVSRGFFEIYHTNVLAQLRQSLRLYLHHVVLWGTPYLWTTFDRMGIKPPCDSKGLPLHVDQNPIVHPGFTTMQGVIALEDCPVERGTFIAVPGSSRFFHEYNEFIASDYKGEYQELRPGKLHDILSAHQQTIPLQQGDIVSWDSRMTHANSDNVSQQNRYVAYVSTGIASSNQDLINIRTAAFTSGLGENMRSAYMHASKRPRFSNQKLLASIRTPEKLNELGLCLYGLKSYKDMK